METEVAVPPEDENSLLTRRFMASCAVILAILLGLGVVAFNHLTREDTPGSAVAAQECDLPASDQTDLVGTPEHGWALVGAGEGAIAVPSTPEHGPVLNTDGVRSCWAQSPMGAVSAATTFAAMGSAGMEHSLARDLTVPGPERDRLLAETPENTAPYQEGVTVEAFRLVDYTKDEAEVTVVMSDGTNYAAATIPLVYTDGDWRYAPPTSLEPEFSFPSSLDGYTEFKEVEQDG